MTSIIKNVFRFCRQPLPPCSVKVCNQGVILPDDLNLLLSNKINCLVIDGYMKGPMLSTEQRLIAGFHPTTKNLSAEHIYYGFTLEDSLKSDNLLYWYYKSAVKSITSHRQAAYPQLTWIDKLRLELDEAHPKGSVVGQIDDKKAEAFVARAYGSSQISLVEARGLPADTKSLNVNTQLVAIQFLVAPKKGGSLQLYPSLLSEQDRQDLYEKKMAIIPSYLPEPAAIIKAFAGRCVFFNAQIPFKFEKVEPEIIPQPNDKPPIIEDISLVVEESYVLHSKDKPLFVLR